MAATRIVELCMLMEDLLARLSGGWAELDEEWSYGSDAGTQLLYLHRTPLFLPVPGRQPNHSPFFNNLCHISPCPRRLRCTGFAPLRSSRLDSASTACVVEHANSQLF